MFRQLKVGRTLCFAWLFAAALALVGCGESPPGVAPVKGRVVYKNQPVANATVLFMKGGAPCFSYGDTNAEGEFTLSTFGEQDGALVGQNVVTVTPRQAVVEEMPDVQRPEDQARLAKMMQQKPKATWPARYSTPSTSDLSVTVEEGANVLTLVLKD